MKKNLFEEEETDMDDNFDNDDFGDEDKANPLVAAGVFLGLIVLTASICVILWNVTHKDKGEEQLVNATETVQEVSEGNESSEPETMESETFDSGAAVDEAVEDVIAESEFEEAQGNAISEEEAVTEPITGNESMEFAEVADTVTAKDVTNLRSAPSTSDAENIVAQLLNGETLSRTGVNEVTGWSRLDYNGQIVYAVSGYLTTDLTYETPVAESDPNRVTTQDGRVIVFTDCDDYVRPKEYVNLRTEPSTSQGESTVRCQISHADIVHRTGYSADSGWSRVEYYGEILYVVSSYVYNSETTE